jgi:D-alanyl-D-alanine carboxypeptidase
MERGFSATSNRKKDLRPAHLLLGVLLAEIGTVPRTLVLAGVDRAELAARVRQSITDNG